MSMKKSSFFSCIVFFIPYSLFSQQGIQVYPTNWWVGMKHHSLQLLIHEDRQIAGQRKVHINYPGLKIISSHSFENGKYTAVDIDITPLAKPGEVSINLSGSETTATVKWMLKERRKGIGKHYAQGVTSADLIYLILPDRFSNGDPLNDRFTSMNDTSCDRKNPFLRHGGDFEGIIQHMNYFTELGATALWLTPVIENNQSLTDEGGSQRSAYHGYAFTNHYQIDRRLGGNKEYKRMIDSAHHHGLKIIQDAVYNHIGNKHFLFLDPPAKDWFNQWPVYTVTSYNDQPLIDQYASKKDYEIAIKGWFTTFMPDLNQQNPYVAKFLIQHALWTVEEFGIDGWRVDTYFYSDKDFLNEINKALYLEYPQISIFGETTMHSVTEQAYYTQNNIQTGWKSNLQGVTDYEWFSGALSAFMDKDSTHDPVSKLYSTLVQDILYKDPFRNEIFYDNHDQNRFFSVIEEDFDKYKMGMALLLTMRGIPQLYYGTEVLMKNLKDPSDAEVRRDFPGGWKEDSINKFVTAGRTARENEAFNYVQTIAKFRLSSSAIKTGRLMQYLPDKGLYVYFRYDSGQTILCAMNTNNKPRHVVFNDYLERTKLFSTGKDVVTGQVYPIPGNLDMPSKSFRILVLQ